VGVGEVDGGIYGSMSAQEFLASAPWNPYRKVVPNTFAPSIVIWAGKVSKGILPLFSRIQTNSNIAQVSWFVDSIKSKALVGANVKLDIHKLSHGLHKIFAFAVNGAQNFGIAQIQISI
jgi:hypothetical protein